MAGDNSAHRPTTAGAVSGIRDAARVPINPLARLGVLRMPIWLRMAVTEALLSWMAIRRRAASMRSDSVAVARESAWARRSATAGTSLATSSPRPHWVTSCTRATLPKSGALATAAWICFTVSGVNVGTRLAGHPAVNPSRMAPEIAGAAPAAANASLRGLGSVAA